MKIRKAVNRIKKRYLIVEARSREDIDKSILEYIGILGVSKARPFFVKENKEKGEFVISVNRKEIDNIRAAFEVSSRDIKIIRVSGTLKGLTGRKV